MTLGKILPEITRSNYVEGPDFHTFPTEAVKILIAAGVVPNRDIRLDKGFVETFDEPVNDGKDLSSLVGVERRASGTSGHQSEQLTLSVSSETSNPKNIRKINCGRTIVSDDLQILQKIEISRSYTPGAHAPCTIEIKDAVRGCDVTLSFDQDYNLVYIDLKDGDNLGAAEITGSSTDKSLRLVGYSSGPMKNNDFSSVSELLRSLNNWLGLNISSTTNLDFNSTIETMLQFDESGQITPIQSFLKFSESSSHQDHRRWLAEMTGSAAIQQENVVLPAYLSHIPLSGLVINDGIDPSDWEIIKQKIIPLAPKTGDVEEAVLARRGLRFLNAQIMSENAFFALIQDAQFAPTGDHWALALIRPKDLRTPLDQLLPQIRSLYSAGSSGEVLAHSLRAAYLVLSGTTSVN